MTDYKLTPNSYVMAMVDEHCFSKMIKNRFERPFSKDFINIMDRTTEYLCEEIQGVKVGQVHDFKENDEFRKMIMILSYDNRN